MAVTGDDYINDGDPSGDNMWPWAVSIYKGMKYRENDLNEVRNISGRKHFDKLWAFTVNQDSSFMIWLVRDMFHLIVDRI